VRQNGGIPADATAGVIAMGKDFMAKKRTIVLSDATDLAKSKVLNMLELTETGAFWPNKPATFMEFPEFEWLTSNEDSPEN
jgi:hypothetical protein